MAEGSSGSDEIRRASQGEDVGGPPPSAASEEELKGHDARSDDEVEAARAEVDQVRAEMTETVDALQEKLEPQNLQEQAKARVTEAARSRGQQILEAVKRNPMPLAVAGGVLFLLLVRRLTTGGTR